MIKIEHLALVALFLMLGSCGDRPAKGLPYDQINQIEVGRISDAPLTIRVTWDGKEYHSCIIYEGTTPTILDYGSYVIIESVNKLSIEKGKCLWIMGDGSTKEAKHKALSVSELNLLLSDKAVGRLVEMNDEKPGSFVALKKWLDELEDNLDKPKLNP